MAVGGGYGFGGDGGFTVGEREIWSVVWVWQHLFFNWKIKGKKKSNTRLGNWWQTENKVRIENEYRIWEIENEFRKWKENMNTPPNNNQTGPKLLQQKLQPYLDLQKASYQALPLHATWRVDQ